MSRRWLIALLVGALVARLLWGLSRPADLSALPDQGEYLALGKNLISGNGLNFEDARFPGVAYAYRTPGYPLLVAACGGSAVGVRIVQAILDATTVLGVWLLARKHAGTAARVSVLLVAACPFLIYFSGLVLTETLFTCMLVWGTWLLVWEPEEHGRDARATWAYVAGILVLALSVLVRPGALGLPVVMAALAGMTRGRLVRVPGAALAGVAVVLVLVPWAWRNHAALNEWVWTSTNSGITAYDGFNPAADGSSNQSFVKDMPELGEMTETQRDDYLSQLARQYAREHPQRAWELAIWKLARTWSPVPLSAENRSVANTVAGGLYCLVAWGLALVGLRRGQMSFGRKVLLLAPALYFSVGAMLTVGSLRYRIPAEPFLAVLSGSGAAAIGLGRRYGAQGQDQPE